MCKRKIPPEEKILAVQKYLEGKESQDSIAKEFGITKSSLQQWICNYESFGKDIFKGCNYVHYPAELKKQAVTDYLNGNGSLISICKKYGIRSKGQLQRWIKMYNRHEELKTSGNGETC